MQPRTLKRAVNLRASPSTSAAVLQPLPADTRLLWADAGHVTADGYTWAQVSVSGVIGWIARLADNWDAMLTPPEIGLVSAWLTADEISQLAALHREIAEILETALARGAR